MDNTLGPAAQAVRDSLVQNQPPNNANEAERLTWFSGVQDRNKLQYAYYKENEYRKRCMEAREHGTHQIPLRVDDEENQLFSVYDPWPVNAYDAEANFHQPISLQSKDRINFGRKRIAALDQVRGLDQSMSNYDFLSTDDVRYHGTQPVVPPTFLHFTLIMEGYLGYKVMEMHDGHGMPQCAYTGGAVLAVLNSWGDPNIREVFNHFIPGFFNNPPIDLTVRSVIQHYHAQRQKIVFHINNLFITKHNPDYENQLLPLSKRQTPSSFSSGDGDIFAQPCISVNRFVNWLGSTHNLPSNVIREIEEYTHCFGFAQSSLPCLLNKFVNSSLLPTINHINSRIETIMTEEDGSSNDFINDEQGFVISTTSRCVSVEYSSQLEATLGVDECVPLWPRGTQIIAMPYGTNLVLGLNDFDISACCVIFDGHTVRCAPRALLSLMSMIIFVTPIVYRETRCRQRLKKYMKREYGGIVFDPNCLCDTRCETGSLFDDERLDGAPHEVGIANNNHLRRRMEMDRDGVLGYRESIGHRNNENRLRGDEILDLTTRPNYHSDGLGHVDTMSQVQLNDRDNTNRSVSDYQQEYGVLYACHCWGDEGVCKCYSSKNTQSQGQCRQHGGMPYTVMLMDGDMDANLAQISAFCNWSDEHARNVQRHMSIDKRRIVVCASIKHLLHYTHLTKSMGAVNFIIDNDGSFVDTSGDVVRSENAVKGFHASDDLTYATGDCTLCFYSGPTMNIDAARSGQQPRVCVGRYQAKENFDMLQYKSRGQFQEAFIPRFAYGLYLVKHNEASITTHGLGPKDIHKWMNLFRPGEWRLRSSRKNPIGLNPERLCESCSECKVPFRMMYLHFGANKCESCSNH